MEMSDDRRPPERRRTVAVHEQPPVALAFLDRRTEHAERARAALVIARDERDLRAFAYECESVAHGAHRTVAHLRPVNDIAEKHDLARAGRARDDAEGRDDLGGTPERQRAAHDVLVREVRVGCDQRSRFRKPREPRRKRRDAARENVRTRSGRRHFHAGNHARGSR
jgi:hypothetical protein